MPPPAIVLQPEQLATAVAGVAAACLHLGVAALGFTVHRRRTPGGTWFSLMCLTGAWASLWTALAPALGQLDPRWRVLSTALSGYGGPFALLFARTSARPVPAPRLAWLALGLPGTLYSALCLSHPPAMAHVEAFVAGAGPRWHPLVSPLYTAHAAAVQGCLLAALIVALRAAWAAPPGPYRSSMGWIAASILIGNLGVLVFSWLPGALAMVELLPVAPLATTVNAALGLRALRLRSEALRAQTATARELARARLESAGRAVQGVAEELGGHLQAAHTHAALAGLATATPEDRAHHLRRLGSAVGAAEALMSRATRALADQPGGARPTSVPAALDALRGRCAVAAPAGGEGGWATADPAALQEALTALLDNAHQAGDPRPVLHVELHDAAVLPPEAIGPATDGGPMVELRLEDRGEGMPPALVAACVSPYFTTRAGRRGSGLTSALRLVHLSGGAFALRSAPGAGTAASLWLPRCAPPPAAAGPELDLRRPAVLLLDADVARADLIQQMLTARGARCLSFTDADTLADARAEGVAPVVLCVQRPLPGEARVVERWLARGAQIVAVGGAWPAPPGVTAIRRPERPRELVQLLLEQLAAASRA